MLSVVGDFKYPIDLSYDISTKQEDWMNKIKKPYKKNKSKKKN